MVDFHIDKKLFHEIVSDCRLTVNSNLQSFSNEISLLFCDNFMQAFSSNGIITVSRRVEIEEKNQGETVLDINVLHSILSKNFHENLKVESSQKKLFLKSKSSSFTLNMILPKNELSEKLKSSTVQKNDCENLIKVNKNDLCQMIEKISFAASKNEIRRYLNGIYMHFENNHLIAVATDGHRLARKSIKVSLENTDLSKMQDFSAIVGLSTIRKVYDVINSKEENDCHIGFLEGKIFFFCSDVVIQSSLVPGNFPDYKSILPNSGNSSQIIQVEKVEALKNAIINVSAIASRNFNGMKIEIKKNEIILRIDDIENGVAEEKVSIKTETSNFFSVSVNWMYFLEIIKNLDSDFTIFLNDNSSPIMIQQKQFNDDLLYVLMPMYI